MVLAARQGENALQAFEREDAELPVRENVAPDAVQRNSTQSNVPRNSTQINVPRNSTYGLLNFWVELRFNPKHNSMLNCVSTLICVLVIKSQTMQPCARSNKGVQEDLTHKKTPTPKGQP